MKHTQPGLPVFNSSVSFGVFEQGISGYSCSSSGSGWGYRKLHDNGRCGSLKFTINVTTDVLDICECAPDFETPLDNGGNNIYNLTVQASDGAFSSVQNITVTVFDVTESTNSAPSGLSASGDCSDAGE